MYSELFIVFVAMLISKMKQAIWLLVLQFVLKILRYHFHRSSTIPIVKKRKGDCTKNGMIKRLRHNCSVRSDRV